MKGLSEIIFKFKMNVLKYTKMQNAKTNDKWNNNYSIFRITKTTVRKRQKGNPVALWVTPQVAGPSHNNLFNLFKCIILTIVGCALDMYVCVGCERKYVKQKQKMNFGIGYLDPMVLSGTICSGSSG